jgi:alpha-tubulin suppressor-like RCC1 family protein
VTPFLPMTRPPSQRRERSALSPIFLGSIPQVAAGTQHSLALAVDGTVWAWGSDAQGQLGNGPNTVLDEAALRPIRVPGVSNVVQVAASAAHSLALNASSCVVAGERVDGGGSDGSRDRTRTYNLPVNSRTLCRLSYAGSTRIRVAHLRWARDAPGSWRSALFGARPDEYPRVMGEGHVCT